MCFSSQASFVAATGLMSLGAYCLHRAFKGDRDYLMLAIIPFFFGVQQFMEGQVWVSLNHQLHARALLFSYGFMFFALFLWPFLFSYASFKIEKEPVRKKIYGRISGVMLAYGVFLYSSLFYGIGLDVNILHNSILYINDPILPRSLARIIYLIAAIPMLTSSNKRLNTLGVLSIASAIIVLIIKQANWTSVWCFAMACISSYILYVVRQSSPAHSNHNGAKEVL